MSTRPPDRQHVVSARDAQEVGARRHVRPVRTEDSPASLAERRRLRRLKKASDENILPPAAVPRGMPFRLYVSMRWVSALIIVSLLLVLFLVFTRDAFFVHVILVGPTKYLSPPEIFERSGLANMHIFWVDPAAVAARLEEDPSVAHAAVEAGWPPNLVQITITEREPALIWVQAGQRVWVDVRGRVMALRRDEKLVQVIVENPSKTIHPGKCSLMGMNEVLGPGSCIDANIVVGVLQFKALYPSVNEIVYDPARGLGYHDGRGWVLWFGDGTDIVTKMSVYNRIVDTVLAAGKHPIEINVVNPDRPYYSSGPTG